MYCKHCGKEIEDDSSFCNHCGKPQGNNQKALTNKPIWIVYVIWTLANLYLLMGEKDWEASSVFFPSLFSDYPSWHKDYYDFSEFIVYVFIIPAIMYVVYRRYKIQIDKSINKILNKWIMKDSKEELEEGLLQPIPKDVASELDKILDDYDID